MKTLPAFKNYDICSFMFDLTNDCVESYDIDVAYDVAALYRITLKGEEKIFWGVRKCGTGMGYKESEILDFYKKNNMIVLFEFSNLRIVDGTIFGNIAMTSYNEKYKNKWYNEDEETKNWYHAGDEFDDFYCEARKITREFLEKSTD